jgi:hypothetical protein
MLLRMTALQVGGTSDSLATGLTVVVGIGAIILLGESARLFPCSLTTVVVHRCIQPLACQGVMCSVCDGRALAVCRQ